MSTAVFQKLRDRIQRETGIWLGDSKRVMLASRLSRRLRELSLATFDDYYAYLQEVRGDNQEFIESINCVTTNKTSFFREPHHFEFLAQKLVPEQASPSIQNENSIHVWSAACSTGEEAYSIAITLLDAISQRRSDPIRPAHLQLEEHSSPWLRTLPPVLKISASDINTNVLKIARAATYDAGGATSLPEAHLKRHFLRGKGLRTGHIRLKREVSHLVHFQRINLMENSWPVSANLDATFFRNALIYFRQETQERILRRMVKLLKPGGYLFLGHSESVPWLHDAVVPIGNTTYQRPRE